MAKSAQAKRRALAPSAENRATPVAIMVRVTQDEHDRIRQHISERTGGFWRPSLSQFCRVLILEALDAKKGGKR